MQTVVSITFIVKEHLEIAVFQKKLFDRRCICDTMYHITDNSIVRTFVGIVKVFYGERGTDRQRERDGGGGI